MFVKYAVKSFIVQTLTISFSQGQGPVTLNIKLLLIPYHNMLECLSMSAFGKARLHFLPSNIIFEWKWLRVTNTLAYYAKASIATLKSFMIQVPGVKFI
jgi:hypothetical protein